MKVSQIVFFGVASVSLVSCGVLGSNGDRIDYGAAAVQTPKLEVPPDLTTPGSDERYRVPQADGGGVATFSDYSKGGAAQLHGPSKVLPEAPGVRLERNSAQRWLVVSDKAENVWPVVKSFWQEIGLTIKNEDQAAGVMETDWAENRAKIPQGGIRSVIGKVFDSVYSSNERDQYRTRLERGKDGVSTEVHISHSSKEEIFSADKSTSRWQTLPHDPEMEAVMLQRLMVRFGASEAQAASAVTAASSVAASGAVASASVPEPAGTSSLREISGSTIIVMNDPFDRSWRKVGLAIESAGLTVEDKDRVKGIYFLGPLNVEGSWKEKLQFWKSKAEAGKHYRVNVKDGGSACEVSVTDQDGVGNVTTKQMIEAIYKNINQ